MSCLSVPPPPIGTCTNKTSDEFGQFMNTSFGVLFHHDDMISTATSASINIQKEVKSSIFEQLLNTVVGKLDRVAYIQSFDIIWEQSELSISWTSEPYDSKIDRANHRKEIALFQSRDLFGDLELSGIRTVIGDEYTAPERTLIIVKPRHNTLKESVSVSLSSGLHPRLHINGLSARPYPSCELFAITNLPKELFFDRYQYNEQKLALLNSWGESDLEAPAWKVSKGSVQLFHILHNESVEIPFHSRYIKPSSPNEFTLAPQLFWGCEAETIIEDWEHMETNPFDTYNLGYESFFEPSTIFYHYSIDPLSLKIPTGDSSNYNLVQFSTIISVVLATCYLVQKIWISYQHSSQKLNTD